MSKRRGAVSERVWAWAWGITICGDQGVGFGVWVRGLGFGVEHMSSPGRRQLRAWDMRECTVKGLGCRVLGSGFGV